MYYETRELSGTHAFTPRHPSMQEMRIERHTFPSYVFAPNAVEHSFIVQLTAP
jgi:hypothetical protein